MKLLALPLWVAYAAVTGTVATGASISRHDAWRVIRRVGGFAYERPQGHHLESCGSTAEVVTKLKQHGLTAASDPSGCWVVAHECGHGAFSDNRRLQTAVG